jgi:DNA gyrase subunit A
MPLNRPDLNGLSPDILAYIEALESALAGREKRSAPSSAEPPLEPTEPPTTINVITLTEQGYAKRTPRHLYSRQRRGGMGIFDLEPPDNALPALIALADETHTLLAVTSWGRAIRLPVSAIPETPVRERGASVLERFNLPAEETLAALLPIQAEGYLAIASRSGMVRLLRHHVFGEHMKPGAALCDSKAFGPLAAACWTPGDSDLFLATRQGRGVRFAEKTVPPQGCMGIRLSERDSVVGIAGVSDGSRVLLVSAEGNGAIRLMSGFSANKAPGAGGKTAMSADQLVGAATVEEEDDVFILSRLSKVIRFSASEIPPKEGVVQGVHCMNFRGDAAVAFTVSPRRL